MIVFHVVKESYGWAVRQDERMMMPAASLDAAIAAAERMVRALSEQGQPGTFQLEKSASS